MLDKIFSLLLSFLSNRQLRVVRNNIQLMMEFLKAPFSVLHFPYYTLITSPMMLSVILLSILMIILSTLSVITHLIYDNKQSLLLNCNLIYEKKWGRERLVDFNAEMAQLVSFDQSSNTGAVDVKMDGSAFEEKLSFKMLGLPFSSKLD